MKGQWFIISAVVATSVFLSISVLLEDYFIIDASSQARVSNDFHFYNIMDQFNYIAENTMTNGSCINLTTRLDELKKLTEDSLGAKGFLVNLEYTINPPDCSGSETVDIDLLVASHEQIIFNFTKYNSSQELIGA